MRGLLALVLSVFIAVAGPAAAAWPEKPVTVLVPFGPGGGADIAARTLGRWIESRLGQPFVIVNRPGAGGEIGFAAIARAIPDGYTIGVVTLPNLVTIPLERRASYAVEQIAPIANLVDDVGGVFVRADSRFRSLADLVAAAKAAPGAISFGTTGIGTYAHFGMLALERQAGISLTPVAYGGTAAMRLALLQGELQVAGVSMTDAAQEMAQGQVRALGQMAAARWSGTPDVPTLREQGFDVVLSSLRGHTARDRGTALGADRGSGRRSGLPSAGQAAGDAAGLLGQRPLCRRNRHAAGALRPGLAGTPLAGEGVSTGLA